MAKLGDKTGHVLELCCDTPLVSKFPLVISETGVLRSEQITGPAIAPNSITMAHIVGLDQILFGPAAGGELTFDGRAIPGTSFASFTYTLTADISASNLTVWDTYTIKTAGYRIFVRDTLRLVGSGQIINNGSNGTSSTNGIGQGSGAGVASGTLGGSQGGGKGGDGGAISGNGVAGSNSTTQNNMFGGWSGGIGGAGGNATGSGGAAGGVPGSASILKTVNSWADAQVLKDTTGAILTGGAAGGAGGGGGGGTTGIGGGGGGGGSGGGVMLICAGTIDISTWGSGSSIQAYGGDGGNGGPPVGNGAQGGGGGGGGGGVIVILCRNVITGANHPNGFVTGASSKTPVAGSTNVLAGGGARGTGANNGTAGANGYILVWTLSQPNDPGTGGWMQKRPSRGVPPRRNPGRGRKNF